MNSSIAHKQTELFGNGGSRQKPFLKWAGGKFRVLDHILAELPDGNRLVEPFAGSAAVALNAGFPNALVADTNADLINLFVSIQVDVGKFIDETKKLFVPETNAREAYGKLRSEFNESSDAFRRSTIFVYLNRHAFNGLCRYNSRGLFNVPFGKYKNPVFPEDEIISFSKAARRMRFKHQGFADTMAAAKEGDVVYCDPPYVPLSVTSNFTSYAPGAFGFPQQRALVDQARACASRGISVLISNHDTPESRALYAGAEIRTFEVRRFISSKAATRGNAPELLAIFR